MVIEVILETGWLTTALCLPWYPPEVWTSRPLGPWHYPADPGDMVPALAPWIGPLSLCYGMRY